MRVLADGRVRRTATEWRGLVERYEQSGLSMTAFCGRAKLSRSSFVKWRRRLERSPRVERPPRGRSPAFVEWIAPPARQGDAGRGGGAGELELSLPGGVVLRWKR
jgi:hypothetical protein